MCIKLLRQFGPVELCFFKVIPFASQYNRDKSNMSKIIAVTIYFFLVVGIFSSTGSALAQQEPNDTTGDIQYITDNLFTFMHAGPGRNYRILGSVEAGTRVTVLQVDTDKGYVEVIDDKQRTGWVEADYVTKQQSLRELVPGLQQELRDANSSVADKESSTNLLSQQLAEVTTRNKRLTEQLSKLEKSNQRIQNELDKQDQTAQMEWLTRGGIIALISIILGVIIAHLPKRKRRTDNWM